MGRSGHIPTITTECLILRPFAWEDLDELARISADPGNRVYVWDGPLSREQTARHIRGWREEYGRGLGFLAVVHESTGELIGQCGLDREGDDGGVGYMLDKAHWGRGLATEAARALLEYGFGVLGLGRIWATAMAENAASRRVMEKLGMGYRRTEHHEAGDEVFYSVSREKFLDERAGRWAARPASVEAATPKEGPCTHWP